MVKDKTLTLFEQSLPPNGSSRKRKPPAKYCPSTQRMQNNKRMAATSCPKRSKPTLPSYPKKNSPQYSSSKNTRFTNNQIFRMLRKDLGTNYVVTPQYKNLTRNRLIAALMRHPNNYHSTFNVY